MYRTPVKISMLLSVMISSHLVSHGFMITRAYSAGGPQPYRATSLLEESFSIEGILVGVHH